MLKDEPDPTAAWSPKRKAWEATMAANRKRANDLLATQQPRRIEVQGLELRRRPRGPGELRRRKRQLWQDRWR